MAYRPALLAAVDGVHRIAVSHRDGDSVASDELANLLQQLGIA